ncbi:hypothetical protein [Thalassobaculum sp.]|uniref:hypothetical protein n=1 Tax=Thalassobaculum sp. TaxID=2022740 RepID=UPI0032EE38B8
MAPLIAGAIALATEFGPGLVRMLAGDKAGDVAEKVSSVAREVTGLASDDEALALVRADPVKAAELRQRLAELEIDLERAYLADRQDARRRDVAIVTAGRYNWRADIMLALAFTSFIAIVWMTWQARLDMPDMVFAFLNMAAGALLKMIGDAFQFEFGSSRGSKEKDQLIRR